MASESNTNPDRPTPAKSTGPSKGQSAKDWSRDQSRPVSGKAAGARPTKGATPARPGKGGNTPKPGGGRPPQAQPRRGLSGPVLAWGAVGLVVVIVVVLVIVKVSSGSGPTTSSHQAVRPASATLVHQLSSVPASTFDKVGVAIPTQYAGDQPIVINGQPPMTLNGRTPTMLYYGAEYCPYCAAERWAMTVALARFGTWQGLQTTASGLNDGDYSTLSFRSATLDSAYIHFVPIEACTNVVDTSVQGCSGYTVLQTPTTAEKAVIDKYASSQFVPTNTQGIAFPFIDVDNKVLFSGSTYLPAGLTGQSQADIAAGLSDTSNPVTQAIIGTANYLSAAVCAASGGQPTAVCQSTGVQAGAKALKLG